MAYGGMTRQKVQFLTGFLCGFLNWIIHFVVPGEPSSKKRVAIYTGTFLHFIGAALLGLSITLLVRDAADVWLRSMKWDDDRRDMCIAYSLFFFAGMCLSTLSVFLRDGSWFWHFCTLFIGIVVCTLSDVSVFAKFKGLFVTRERRGIDVWEVEDDSGSRPGLHRRR
eukprot:Hpha_TRINITY_DN16456_c0_g4::TRINITY_DN16456_c0_g4_i1::g.161879::m.161879